MRAAVTITVTPRPEFSLAAVTCWEDHVGWSKPEVCDAHQMLFVRRGRCRRQAAGVAADVDPTVASLSTPGEEEQFAYPSGGSACTFLEVSPTLWRVLAGDTARPARPTVYVDARLDLAHRRFLAAASAGDVDYALTEELLGLLAAAVRQAVTEPTPAHQQAAPGDSAVVAAAREAISADDPAANGLLTLAELLGVSPYRLSRAFPRELGVSLTRYRNRVRVARALDRLTAGEPNLSALAADLGFADHAHLSRTIREHLGHTPTALRGLLHSDRSRR